MFLKEKVLGQEGIGGNKLQKQTTNCILLF